MTRSSASSGLHPLSSCLPASGTALDSGTSGGFHICAIRTEEVGYHLVLDSVLSFGPGIFKWQTAGQNQPAKGCEMAHDDTQMMDIFF